LMHGVLLYYPWGKGSGTKEILARSMIPQIRSKVKYLSAVCFSLNKNKGLAPLVDRLLLPLSPRL